MPDTHKAMFSIWFDPELNLGTVVFSVNLEERGQPPLDTHNFMGNVPVEGTCLNGEFRSEEVDEARRIAVCQLRMLGAKRVNILE